MPLLLTLLPLLMQTGPYSFPGAGSAPNVPRVEGRDTPRRRATAPPLFLPPPIRSAGQTCQDLLEAPAAEAAEMARERAAAAKAEDIAGAQGCLGMALSRLAAWDEAEAAFVTAREAAGEDRAARANYGAMAGNAALAGGHADRALAAFDRAKTDAEPLGDRVVSGEIALDRVRALVALRRTAEAREALDFVLASLTGNSDAWLLSATLYRREKQYGPAQRQIEKAAAINNADPAIALEAGVIAMLAGREADARKSWQSAITVAPGSDEAARAKDYLRQIGEAPDAPGPASAPVPGR